MHIGMAELIESCSVAVVHLFRIERNSTKQLRLLESVCRFGQARRDGGL